VCVSKKMREHESDRARERESERECVEESFRVLCAHVVGCFGGVPVRVCVGERRKALARDHHLCRLPCRTLAYRRSRSLQQPPRLAAAVAEAEQG